MAKHVFNHMANVKRKDFFMISWNDFLKLKPFHLNPVSRTEGFGNDEDDQNLINFIKNNGVLNLPPIGINKTQNGDIIVNGHRCSAAIKIAKEQGAPVEYVNAILVGKNMTITRMLKAAATKMFNIAFWLIGIPETRSARLTPAIIHRDKPPDVHRDYQGQTYVFALVQD